MDTEEVLQRMIDADIVESDGGHVFPTAEFEARCSELQTPENTQHRPEWLTADLIDPERLDDGFVATAQAVAEFTDGMTDHEVVAAATALDRLAEPPRTTSVPEEFVPLHQEDLRGFLVEHRASVIFVWTPGSSSCERMADTLSRLHTLPPVDETIGLGSICVEDGAELLGEEYDVAILPTTLYFVGRSVDARTIGPRDLDHVKRAVEILITDTNGAVSPSLSDTQSSQ